MQGAILAAAEASGKKRDPRERQKQHREVCKGIRCEFLKRGGRYMLPRMLNTMNYSGKSAEIGVWQGSNSVKVLRMWSKGSTHLLVDPYAHFDAFCGGNSNRPVYGRRGDKHCTFSQVSLLHPGAQGLRSACSAFVVLIGR